MSYDAMSFAGVNAELSYYIVAITSIGQENDVNDPIR